jgi:lipopolysaccharide export system permease protein
MRILDRYAARQLLPVWIWCLLVFVSLSCLIDLFEHLDEILRYRIPRETVLLYYASFVPLIFVRASPLALLLSSAFVASRLARHQELLAMNASGTSLLRASVPFLFVGWLAGLAVFIVNDCVVPKTSAVYEQLRQEAFRGRKGDEVFENVAAMDTFNRLYHARQLDLAASELDDLTVLEHDWHNRPTKSLHANRAVWTKHGWLLLQGTIYRVGPRGVLQGEPETFAERVIFYPVKPRSFLQSDTRPDMMRYAQLRLLVIRMKQAKFPKVRRYEVELASKLTFPLMNVVVCFIGFAGATQPQLRGNLRGLMTSFGWGMAYYLAVASSLGVAKEWSIPILPIIWAPHVAAVLWCLRVLRRIP